MAPPISPIHKAATDMVKAFFGVTDRRSPMIAFPVRWGLSRGLLATPRMLVRTPSAPNGEN